MKASAFFTRPGEADKYYAFDQKDDPSSTMIQTLAKMILKRKPEGYSRIDHVLVDIGCAYGKSLFTMAGILGFKKAVGIDVSEDLLKMLKTQAKSKLKKVELKTFCVDLEAGRIPLANQSISIVSCFGTALYLESLENLFSEVARILRPNGIFCVTITADMKSEVSIKNEHGGLDFYIHSEANIVSLMEKYNFAFGDDSMALPNPELGEDVKEGYLFLIKKKT
jgi:SAM-dependent methyltransferase